MLAKMLVNSIMLQDEDIDYLFDVVKPIAQRALRLENNKHAKRMGKGMGSLNDADKTFNSIVHQTIEKKMNKRINKPSFHGVTRKVATLHVSAPIAMPTKVEVVVERVWTDDQSIDYYKAWEPEHRNVFVDKRDGTHRV